MQLTLEIPDAHLGEVLTFIAGLVAKTSTVPGHPELPLAGIDAADPLKVAMDDPIFDERDPIAPQVGMQFYTRDGSVARINSREGSLFYGEIKLGDKHIGGVTWKSDGRSVIFGNDLIEPTPF